VIHAMHHEQDMRKMGGLRSYIPQTYRTFLIATLAIAGIFPFAGFFSKDEILWNAFGYGKYFLWGFGILPAGLTAFYMFRQVFLTATTVPSRCAAAFPRLYKGSLNTWYVDEIYDALFINPIKKLTGVLDLVARWMVDGVVNGVRQLTIGISWLSKGFDKGFVD